MQLHLHTKPLLIATIVVLSYNSAKAQQMLYGHVADSADGSFLQSVYVGLLRDDSTEIAHTVTDEQGHYTFASPGKGSYILHCTHIGYAETYQRFDITVPKRITEVNADLIRMRREAKMLDEVKVTATKIKMVMRSDTIVYNADAFQLAEGSMLNALVSELPGVTLEDDGRIYVNGKFVSSLMLNGRDFFRGNPLIALENLPAYIVKNVKVYDKAGEASQLLGRDAGDKSLVMDVYLKKEYNEGYILNADNGYGTKDRYKSQLFGLRFTSLSRMSLFSNINNVNNKHRPGSKGDWKGDETPSGRLRTISVGGEYSYETKKHDLGLTVTPLFMRTRGDDRTWTSGQTYLNNGDLFHRTINSSMARQTALSLDNRLWMRRGKWYGNFSASLGYQRNRLNGLNRTAQFMENPGMSTEILDSIEQGTTTVADIYNYIRNETKGNGETYKTMASTNNRFNIGGDLLTIDGSYSYDKDYSREFSLYQSDNYCEGGTYGQHTFRNKSNHGYDVNAGICYQTFLTGGFNDFLIFRYAFHEKAFNVSNPFYRLNRDSAAIREIEWLPSQRNAMQTFLDIPNSYNASEHDYTHTFSARFRYSWQPWDMHTLIMTLDAPIVWQNNILNYQRVNHYDVNRSKTFFNPAITLSDDYMTLDVMQSAIIGVNLTHDMPLMESLAPYTDGSDPYCILVGNPSLDNIRTFKAFASFSRRASKHQQNFSTRLEFTNIQGAVASALLFDTNNGVRTIQPRNVYGNWNIKLNIDGGKAIAMKDRLSFSNKFQAMYQHSVDINSTDYDSPQRSPVNNLDMKDALQLNYDVGKDLKIGMTLSGTFDRVSSDIHSFDSYTIGNYAYGGNIVWNIPCGFQLATDIRVSVNRGYSDKEMNKTEAVWNARLTKNFLKGRLQFMLDGFDLLGQLSNHRYVLNCQGRIESYTNAIPRYAMLHATYRFNKNPKKK